MKCDLCGKELPEDDKELAASFVLKVDTTDDSIEKSKTQILHRSCAKLRIKKAKFIEGYEYLPERYSRYWETIFVIIFNEKYEGHKTHILGLKCD